MLTEIASILAAVFSFFGALWAFRVWDAKQKAERLHVWVESLRSGEKGATIRLRVTNFRPLPAEIRQLECDFGTFMKSGPYDVASGKCEKVDTHERVLAAGKALSPGESDSITASICADGGAKSVGVQVLKEGDETFSLLIYRTT